MTVDRVVGMVLGGAIGDGWGRLFEGHSPQAPATPPVELISTDDTQLTIATCERSSRVGFSELPQDLVARVRDGIEYEAIARGFGELVREPA
jgi:hypothetical protein